MVIEIVGLWIDVYWLDLGLECQFRWLLVLLVRCHSSFLSHDRVEHGDPLWHLRLLHVVLVHVLVQGHHVLFAFPCVGLSRLHCLHQAVSVVREVELVSIWRDIHIVVQATTIQGTHLIHARVEVDIVTSSKGAVGWVHVTLGRRRPEWIEMQLTWTWDDHIFFCLLLLSFFVVMMVMMMHVTKIWVDETVSLDLSGRLKVEVLVWMHPFEVTTLTWSIRSMVVVMMTTLLLRIPLRLFLLSWGLSWLGHFFVVFGLGSADLRWLGVWNFLNLFWHLLDFLLLFSLLSSLNLHFFDSFKLFLFLDFLFFL